MAIKQYIPCKSEVSVSCFLFGDTSSLPSIRALVCPDIPDCLPHPPLKHANPLSLLLSRNTGSKCSENRRGKGEIFQCTYEVISCTVMNVDNSQEG